MRGEWPTFQLLGDGGEHGTAMAGKAPISDESLGIASPDCEDDELVLLECDHLVFMYIHVPYDPYVCYIYMVTLTINIPQSC